MAVQNSLTRSKSNQRFGITAYLTQDAVKQQINNVIGGKDGQRFISAIVSAVNTNPALQECTNQSILSGALLGESLKLSPSPQLGHYYLVPFNDKEKGKVATFQLGYKGYGKDWYCFERGCDCTESGKIKTVSDISGSGTASI